ncbi:hypothetical protein [Streptomyces sp. NPDC020681]|uniref:hypothetical protein n=1 Tax=Streptomyces sp. NPDC020681 TaxID=3365083 RepID=UPI00379B1325
MDYLPYPPVEADRIDLFDSERVETQYVIFGGHRPTYAFTDPSKVYDGHLSEWIPMGYKILRMAQKVAFLRNGDVVRQWPVVYRNLRVDPPDPAPGTTLYLDNWRRSVCGYLVMTAPNAVAEPEDAYDATGALAMAADASHQGDTVLLYVYDAENWH